MANDMMTDPNPDAQQTGQGESMGPGKPQNPDTGGAKDPIILAFEDIAKFIDAQQKAGNPQASAMMQKFQELLQAMQGGGEGEQPSPEAAPQPGAEPGGVRPVSPGGVNRGGVSKPLEKNVPVL